MKIDFTGKKAIVCGGSRGIGKAIALGFAACGGDVSICARDPKTLEETRAEIAKHGHKAHAASADLAEWRRGARLRDATRSRRWAASTSWSTTPRPSASSDDDKGWTSNLAVDMMSIVHATQEALPALKQSPGQRGEHLLDRGAPSRGAPAALRRDQGGGDPLHHHAGRDVRQGPRARELHRAGLDRVPRRRVGPAQDRQSRRSTTPR